MNKQKRKTVNRVREPLKIIVEYTPNDYYDDGDNWELGITVNEANSGNGVITPFTCRLPDLTPHQIGKEIAEKIREELGMG